MGNVVSKNTWNTQFRREVLHLLDSWVQFSNSTIFISFLAMDIPTYSYDIDIVKDFLQIM